MYLNIEKVGKPYCKVIGGKYANRQVCLAPEDEADEVKKTYSNFSIDDGKLQHLPDATKERDILYITGASGSGKSTYTANYLREYIKKFKDNPIYLFSALTSDETIDEIKQLKRVKLDERMITEPLDVAEFADSCVIFDDVDVIGDKKIREAVYCLLNQILEVGRHHHISCIITNHLATNGKDTRRILNEAHTITFFPHSGSARGIKYLLETYCGLDKKDISKLKHSKSRWATIFKNYPQIAMTERSIFILAEEC